jgi:hypothetical protein
MLLMKEPQCGALETGETLADTLTERRRGLRIEQSRPVKIFEPTLARYYGGRTYDISVTGLRLEMPISTPLRPGSVIHVHVGAGDSGEGLGYRRNMVPVRVVWVDRDSSQDSPTLTAGVELVASISARLDAA